MKQLIILLLMFSFVLEVSAQNKRQCEAIADSLTEAFPDDYVVSLESEEIYDFTLTESKYALSPLAIQLKKNVKFIALTDYVNYKIGLLYNDVSSYGNINVSSTKKGTYIPVNDETFNESGFFYSDMRIKKVELPFESKADILKLFYHKTYYDYKYLASIYFHETYPVELKKIEFKVPKWLDVEIIEFNFKGYDITKLVKQNKKKNFTTYTYTIRKLNSYPDEEDLPGSSHYLPHLVLICKSIKLKNNEYPLMKNTDYLYKWYHGLALQINNQPNELKELVDKLIKDKKYDIEKVKAIFYWVQDNIRYIAFEDGIAGFKPDNCQNVFHNKYGDCKGMANLTKEMLKLAGFDARLSYIGTNRIAYSYSIPSLAVDNHMICTLFLDEKIYFLDATESFVSIDNLAERIQGKEVLIENGNEYIIEKIPFLPSENNLIEINKKMQIKSKKITGTAEYKYNGESKTKFLQGYNALRQDIKEEALDYYLRQGNKNLEISNIQTSNLNNRDTNLEFTYDFVFQNNIINNNSDIYVNLEYDKEFEFPELEKERDIDFCFNNKMNYKVVVELTIPDNYLVGSLPENIEKSDSNISVKVNYSVKNNKIFYTKELSLKNILIHKDHIESLKEIIGELRENYGSYIILKRV